MPQSTHQSALAVERGCSPTSHFALEERAARTSGQIASAPAPDAEAAGISNLWDIPEEAQGAMLPAPRVTKSCYPSATGASARLIQSTEAASARRTQDSRVAAPKGRASVTSMQHTSQPQPGDTGAATHSMSPDSPLTEVAGEHQQPTGSGSGSGTGSSEPSSSSTSDEEAAEAPNDDGECVSAQGITAMQPKPQAPPAQDSIVRRANVLQHNGAEHSLGSLLPNQALISTSAAPLRSMSGAQRQLGGNLQPDSPAESAMGRKALDEGHQHPASFGQGFTFGHDTGAEVPALFGGFGGSMAGRLDQPPTQSAAAALQHVEQPSKQLPFGFAKTAAFAAGMPALNSRDPLGHPAVGDRPDIALTHMQQAQSDQAATEEGDGEWAEDEGSKEMASSGHDYSETSEMWATPGQSGSLGHSSTSSRSDALQRGPLGDVCRTCAPAQ